MYTTSVSFTAIVCLLPLSRLEAHREFSLFLTPVAHWRANGYTRIIQPWCVSSTSEPTAKSRGFANEEEHLADRRKKEIKRKVKSAGRRKKRREKQSRRNEDGLLVCTTTRINFVHRGSVTEARRRFVQIRCEFRSQCSGNGLFSTRREN